MRIPTLRPNGGGTSNSLTDQEFVTETGPIYEGVATVMGTLEGTKVSGEEAAFDPPFGRLARRRSRAAAGLLGGRYGNGRLIVRLASP